MIEQLFGSKTRVKLLELFYSNPNRPFYVREITRKIDEQINSVRRELANLLNAGIITSETTNSRLYYEVNQSYEFFQPLSEIFGKGRAKKTTKTTKANSQDEDLKALGNVELALYTGQFTRDESSGVDFLIVGNVNHNQVEKYVAELEKKEGKEIRYTVMTTSDFDYRRNIKDRFITGIMSAKKQVLIDKNSVFE
jgi:predicted transcriptional regulator